MQELSQEEEITKKYGHNQETYYVKIIEHPNGNLEIIPKKPDEIGKECRDLFDLLQEFIGNTSYRWIDAGLTEMPTFGIVTKENDEGVAVECSEMYGDSKYAVRDPIKELAKGNPIILVKYE